MLLLETYDDNPKTKSSNCKLLERIKGMNINQSQNSRSKAQRNTDGYSGLTPGADCLKRLKVKPKTQPDNYQRHKEYLNLRDDFPCLHSLVFFERNGY